MTRLRRFIMRLRRVEPDRGAVELARPRRTLVPGPAVGGRPTQCEIEFEHGHHLWMRRIDERHAVNAYCPGLMSRDAYDRAWSAMTQHPSSPRTAP